MQAIAEDIYIETQYLGVTLGVIRRPQGLILIDAPLSLESARTWRAAFLSLGGGPDRLLVNLDPHPDRTLGARAMECTIVAQERTAHIFRNRPVTFKAGAEETGADWETGSALTNIRWIPPEISFTQHLKIYWDDLLVLVESHPGPSRGACWAIIPERQVVFVGDAVVIHQPPFLASADIPAWLDSLDALLTLQSYQIVSGRNGVVPLEAVKAQKDYLNRVFRALQERAKSQGLSPQELDKLVNVFLSEFEIAPDRARQYAQRLRYGLSRCYVRHFQGGEVGEDE